MAAHNALPMRIEDYAALKGIKTRRQPCPFCGNKTSFSISEKKQVFNCLSTHCPSNVGGKQGGNVLTMCALLEGCSTKEAYAKLVELAGNSGMCAAIPKTRKEAEESDAELASIEVRNKTYTALLSHLKLGDAHKEELTRRGFQSSFWFRTYDLSEEERERICRVLIREGCTLKGVPGFYMNNKKNWMLAYSKRAITVPYLDEKYRIQGMQLRKDSSVLKNGENKYTWFSSSYLPSGSVAGTGTRARTFVHYATYVEGSDGKMRHKFEDGVCFLTEGAMKAQLAHELSGQAFIAVPGVNALTKLGEAIDVLKSKGVTRIINAYDMDYLVNPNVAEAVSKTEEMIKEKGLLYNRLVWDENPGDFSGAKGLKGIDDYFAYKVRATRP